MIYATFLEESYLAIREQAPHVAQIDRVQPWLVSIGEVLLGMPPAVQAIWLDQYAVLVMLKYGYLHPDVAVASIRYGLTMAQARWPKVTERVR